MTSHEQHTQSKARQGSLEQSSRQNNQHTQLNNASSLARLNNTLALQRTIGNQAVLRLLNRTRNSSAGNQMADKALNPSDHDIQRTRLDSRANAHYSHVLPGQKITQNNSVITATAFKGAGGGHSSVYIESLSKDEDPKPNDIKIHLTYDPTNKVTHIRIEPGRLPREPKKRSWVRSAADAEAAIEKAELIANEPQTKKKYRFLGGSLTKGGMNCAKFAERILKAAGINASAGWIFKTPAELATGKNKGHEDTLDQDIKSYQNNRKKEVDQNDQYKENFYKQPNLYDMADYRKQIEEVKIDPAQSEWLSKTVGKDFILDKELPAAQCNRDGTGKQPPANLPTGAHILVANESRKPGEVLIECIQPRGYFIVNLSLLIDSAPADLHN